MDRIRIRGGKRLKGKIPISGAKNAGLPLMAASLLSEEPLLLGNLPHLADISTMASLLGELGVEIAMEGDAPNGGHFGRVYGFLVAPWVLIFGMLFENAIFCIHRNHRVYVNV